MSGAAGQEESVNAQAAGEGNVETKKSAKSANAGTQSESLEGLFGQLKQQLSSSDWLKENTAEKWQQENPELAAEWKKYNDQRRTSSSQQTDQ